MKCYKGRQKQRRYIENRGLCPSQDGVNGDRRAFMLQDIDRVHSLPADSLPTTNVIGDTFWRALCKECLADCKNTRRELRGSAILVCSEYLEILDVGRCCVYGEKSRGILRTRL